MYYFVKENTGRGLLSAAFSGENALQRTESEIRGEVGDSTIGAIRELHGHKKFDINT